MPPWQCWLQGRGITILECVEGESIDDFLFELGDEFVQVRAFFSDQKRLKVILNNLLSNAIRYSNKENPQIKIGVKVDEAIAKITITDNGLGIGKEHVKNVFKMFYRATENNAGSGLGLYIVKETVDKLRGNVELNSLLDEGTTVNLEIPNNSIN